MCLSKDEQENIGKQINSDVGSKSEPRSREISLVVLDSTAIIQYENCRRCIGCGHISLVKRYESGLYKGDVEPADYCYCYYDPTNECNCHFDLTT